MQGQIPTNTSDSDLQLRLPARNVGDTEIPTYGVLEVTDVEYDDVFGEVVILVQRPTADSRKTIVINTEATIPAGEYGQVTPTFPTWVLYDSADGVPALNEQWGPASGSYKAKKSKVGFLAVPLASGSNPILTDVNMMMLEICQGGGSSTIGSSGGGSGSSGGGGGSEADWDGIWDGIWDGLW